MTDFEHDINLKKATQLKEEGYEFEYDADSYKVVFKGKFVGAAGVKLPRNKPLHWKHRRANIKDNLSYCIITAEHHKRSNES